MIARGSPPLSLLARAFRHSAPLPHPARPAPPRALPTVPRHSVALAPPSYSPLPLFFCPSHPVPRYRLAGRPPLRHIAIKRALARGGDTGGSVRDGQGGRRHARGRKTRKSCIYIYIYIYIIRGRAYTEMGRRHEASRHDKS